MDRLFRIRTIGIVGVVIASLGAQERRHFSPREKAFYADAQTVQFVNPGLVITVTGATIASDGTITAQYTLADPKGLPLDSAGVTTPGTISTSFVAAYLPNGQEQYTAYTTRAASGTVIPSTQQPGADSGGTVSALGNGAYQYVFKTKAPAGFDPTATHTIGIYGSRNLTAYSLGTNYASTTFNFVPNGANVTHTRDVIETASCNQCHEQLSAHGGSRRGVNLCVMCHTPQNVDPNSGLRQSISSSSSTRSTWVRQLPSVVAGGTYEITTSFGTSDYSTVSIRPIRAALRGLPPADHGRGASQGVPDQSYARGLRLLPRRRELRHRRRTTPADFQTDDTQCANCHIPQGETPFDASIMGAHVVPDRYGGAVSAESGYADHRASTCLSPASRIPTRAARRWSPSRCSITTRTQSRCRAGLAFVHHGGSDHRLRLHHLRNEHEHAGVCHRKRD